MEFQTVMEEWFKTKAPEKDIVAHIEKMTANVLHYLPIQTDTDSYLHNPVACCGVFYVLYTHCNE